MSGPDADKGPIFEVEANMMPPSGHFLLEGAIKIFGFSVHVLIYIGTKKLRFEFDATLRVSCLRAPLCREGERAPGG